MRMHRFVGYTLLFIILVLLQVLLFNNLYFSLYVNPLVYISFVILLPGNIRGVWLLLLSLLVGLVVDLFSGTPGINTIATLLVAFCRPGLLTLIMGHDEVRELVVPDVPHMGLGKFIKYVSVMVLVHASAFFMLEVLSWKYFGFTLLRIVFSSLASIVFVYFCQRLFRGR